MMRHVILMDMSFEGTMNGVTRCIQVLAESFSKEKDYSVTWIHFEKKRQSEDLSIEQDDSKITIALPNDLGNFLSSSQIQQDYWEKSYQIVCPLLQNHNRNILHIHTLNLIDFAMYIRERINCKIVSHLHCIPWKGLYNRDVTLFTSLYERYYISREYSQSSSFVLHKYEDLCYSQSDCIICVTRCAREFIKRMYPHHTIPVKVVYNGIEDIGNDEVIEQRQLHYPVRCLFVGNAHASKGLDYALQSLDLLRMKYEINIVVAGGFTSHQQKQITAKYPFVDVQFVGVISLMELRKYYLSCDIGLIASTQEQCSYVAIEMMMFGLPVVTTDIDGLHELFAGKNVACKIPLCHIPGNSIYTDSRKMAESLLWLIEHPKQRVQMGWNARQRYKQLYNKDRMAISIKKIYDTL